MKLLRSSRRLKSDRGFLGLADGELAEVKKAEDILLTLDRNSELEGLPFMDEMWQYCGKELKVLKRVGKIIVEGVGVRYIKNTVILEGVECGGEAHGDCKRTCPILWKEAWLQRPHAQSSSHALERPSIEIGRGHLDSGASKLKCQSASLMQSSSDLAFWNPRRYQDDVRKGRIGPLLISVNFLVQKLLTGRRRVGLSSGRRTTPSGSLHLQPGEFVEVRNLQGILLTLDASGKNRGLEFTTEMQEYCGRRFRVLKALDRMIIEQTGKMRQIGNTVILEGVHCDGKAHGGCPRNCYCMFREIWLKRVKDET